MKFRNSSVDENTFVFFDLETTGLSPEQGDAICEIGAIKVEGTQVRETFHTLVNPQRPIPQEVSAIHSIYDDDVKDAPYFREVVDRFLYFLGNSIICAYNVGFDLGFLNYQLTQINYPTVELPAIDILVMARKTFHNLQRYNLRALAEYLKIPAVQFHRALDDAHVTKEIFFKIKGILARQGVTLIQDYITLYGFTNEFFRRNEEPKLSVIRESIIARVALQMSYLSSSNELRTFVVIPKEIIENRGYRYLLAWSARDNEVLKLNLSRILRAEVV